MHARCSSAALQGKLKTALLVTAIAPVSFLGLHTLLKQPSTDAQQQCLGPDACPLQQCCSARQVENSLACHCNTPVSFWTSYIA
jgi:hypothetical protein